MSCELFYYSGIGECKALRESLAGMLPMTKKTTATMANAALLSAWKTALVAVAGAKGIFLPARNYEVTSDEPEMTTLALGYTEKTRENPPRMTMYGKMNYRDYVNWFGADGKEFEIVLPLENGNVLGTKTSAGLFKGFRGRFYLHSNIPKIGADLQNEAIFYVVFDNLEEWKNIVEVATDFTIPELEDINPIGVEIAVKTAYTAGDVVVTAVKSGGTEPVTDLSATTNWSVKKAFADLDVEVTAVDATSAALGIYTLTIQKDASGAPANLTDDVIIQAVNDDATYITYLSNPLRVTV